MDSDQNPYQSPRNNGHSTQAKTNASGITAGDRIGITTVVLVGALLAGLDWGTDGRFGWGPQGGFGVFVQYGPMVVFSIVAAWTFLAATRGSSLSLPVRCCYAIGLIVCLTPVAYIAFVATCVPSMIFTGHDGFAVHGPVRRQDVTIARMLVAGGITFLLVSMIGGAVYFFVRLFRNAGRTKPV